MGSIDHKLLERLSREQNEIIARRSINIADCCNILHQELEEYFAQPPKGIYVMGRLEPAMVDGGYYFTIDPDTTEECQVTDLTDVVGHVYTRLPSRPGSNGNKIILSANLIKNKNRFLSTRPVYPYAATRLAYNWIASEIYTNLKYPALPDLYPDNEIWAGNTAPDLGNGCCFSVQELYDTRISACLSALQAKYARDLMCKVSMKFGFFPQLSGSEPEPKNIAEFIMNWLRYQHGGNIIEQISPAPSALIGRQINSLTARELVSFLDQYKIGQLIDAIIDVRSQHILSANLDWMTRPNVLDDLCNVLFDSNYGITSWPIDREGIARQCELDYSTMLVEDQLADSLKVRVDRIMRAYIDIDNLLLPTQAHHLHTVRLMSPGHVQVNVGIDHRAHQWLNHQIKCLVDEAAQAD